MVKAHQLTEGMKFYYFGVECTADTVTQIPSRDTVVVKVCGEDCPATFRWNDKIEIVK